MGRQPYMPLYVGDWLKDTRLLPAGVRGVWIDLILFMWDNHTRGEMVGSVDEIARIASCSPEEAKFALLLLQQKKTADIVLLASGEFHIISRRMKKDIELSRIRSEVGKTGVEAKKKLKFASAKNKQNPDIEYEYDNEDVINKEGVTKSIFEDELFIADLIRNNPGKDLNDAWEQCWLHFSQQPNKLLEWEWRQKYSSWLTRYTQQKKGKTKLVDLTDI